MIILNKISSKMFYNAYVYLNIIYNHFHIFFELPFIQQAVCWCRLVTSIYYPCIFVLFYTWEKNLQHFSYKCKIENFLVLLHSASITRLFFTRSSQLFWNDYSCSITYSNELKNVNSTLPRFLKSWYLFICIKVITFSVFSGPQW